MPIIVRSKRSENRFYIDNEFLNGYAKRVGWQGQCVYPALCRHEKSGKAFPSIKHLAQELGISDSSVRRGIENLKEYNIILVERVGKTLNNIYWLLDYKEWKKLPKSDWSNRTLTPSDCSVGQSDCSHRKSDCSVGTPNNTNRTILINNTNNIYMSYKNKINSKSILTSTGRKNIQNCLRHYSEDKLLKAIDNKSRDTWFMSHNANRGITWFFSSLARIARYIEEEPRKQLSNRIS